MDSCYTAYLVADIVKKLVTEKLKSLTVVATPLQQVTVTYEGERVGMIQITEHMRWEVLHDLRDNFRIEERWISASDGDDLTEVSGQTVYEFHPK